MPGGEYLSLEHFNNPIALGQVGDPNMMVAGPSRYDSGFVIPDYDASDPNYQYEVLNKLKAENQGFGMELATAGANLIPNIALSLAETTGYLFDLEDWSNMIQGNKANYGNALTEWANSNKNQFGEVYQKTPGENDISDSAWWVSNGGGLVESLVAFGITGYGVGSLFSKGASALTKALGAYGSTAKAAQGVAQLGTSLTLAYSEGAMTGAQVFKDVYADSYNRKYQENLALGMGDNEAKTRAHYDATDIAGESATKAVRINTGINTFLNIPETGVLFRSMSSSRYIDDALKLQRGEFARDAVERLKTFNVDKHLTKQGIKHWGKETGSEMLEEMVNVYAEQEGKNVGREATGQDITTLGDMLADDDIWAAGFWGAIGGSMNGFVMGQMPKWVTQEDGTQKRTTVGAYNKEQIKNKYKEQLTDLQDRLTEFVGARDALEIASKSGDERAYKEAADKVFSYNSFNSIVKGTEEQLLNDFREIFSLTPEQATQQGFASDYKQRASEKIQSVKENTEKWNKIQDKHSSQDLDKAGFPETIFQQHMNVKNNKKIIQENTIELAKLEAEIAESNNLRGTDLTITSFNDVVSNINAVEHSFEMATIEYDNILNLAIYSSRQRKDIIAKLSNKYGNIANARTEIEKHLDELNEKRKDLVNVLEIQKANYYFFLDPDNKMSEEEKQAKYDSVIIQNTVDINALTDGKKILEENKKVLASQEEELRVLESDKGLERFKELKKEKMAEREALDAEVATKAKAEAEAKAEAAKIAEIKAKKQVAPEAVTVEEEEIIQAATPVESYEEGNYAGEGSSDDEFKEQFKDITEEANNSEDLDVVNDVSDSPISINNKLIFGANKLAYASTVEYVENPNGLKHTSLKLNPETNPNLLTDAYVPGTKLKIRKLTAEEFKPREFVAVKEIAFIDELGRRILVANPGQTVTFAMLDHPYMQPIGIFNEAGEYQAMLHATSYINADRIVAKNVAEDLQTLINIRAAVTNEFQDITIESKTNGKINKLPKFYTLSELIDESVEFAIATSSIQLNTSKTTPVEDVVNKKGFKVGQVYAITVMPDGRKVAIPVKTTKVKENPQVLTELMSALDTFLEGGKRQDLQNIFSQYLFSVFSSDKLTKSDNAFDEDPNGKDRFYIDFTSTNVDGIIFGKAGSSKYFINSKTSGAALENYKKELISIILESYININFESLKNSDFVKKHVKSDVRFYPLPNGKVTVFDNPVIGFDTSTLINATAPAAKVTPTPAPVITPITAVFSEPDVEIVAAIIPQIKTIEEIKNDIAKYRADEQAKYDAMSDPNDTAARDKIYQEYDKLITPLIDKAEADIEKRKEEKIKKIETNFWVNNEKAYLEFLDELGGYELKAFKNNNEVADYLKDRVQTKYNAELDAVKQVKPATTPTVQPTPAAETSTTDVKTGIENRRQEALNKKDPQSGELLKENSISKQVLKEREGVNSFINASKGLNIDVDDIKIAAKLDNSFTSLPSNIQQLLWEGKTEEALKEIGKTYEEEINDKYDIELARELYKELKAGKIVTEFTPAEQQILYNPTILTQELKDSVDAEIAALEEKTETPTVDAKVAAESKALEILNRYAERSDNVTEYQGDELEGPTSEDEGESASTTLSKIIDVFKSLPPTPYNFTSKSIEEFKEKVRNELLDAGLENMIDDVIYNITKLVNEQYPKTKSEITKYGDYTIYKGEDGTYDVQHDKGDGIIGEYISTKEEAIAIADRHKKQLENKPAVELKSAGGAKFKIRLDEDEDTDYSMTTVEENEKSVSLQDKVNTLIEEGKATKFCK